MCEVFHDGGCRVQRPVGHLTLDGGLGVFEL